MRISLTVAYRNQPEFDKIYSTCDLLFASSGYNENDKADINRKFAGKVVYLSHSTGSNDILDFLKTGDTSSFTPEQLREAETIKASLPRWEELEIYAYREIRDKRPPAKLTLT